MIKITKKIVKDWVDNAILQEESFNKTLYIFTAYIYEGKLNVTFAVHGQGYSSIIYNGKEDISIKLLGLYNEYRAYNSCTKKELIDSIYNEVKEMIAEYYED